MAKLFESIGKLGLALAVGGGVVNSALFNGKYWADDLLHFGCLKYWTILGSAQIIYYF